MATSEAKIAKRYAKALFDSCQPAKLEEMRGVVNSFARTWEANPALGEAMANPGVPRDQRAEVMKDVAKAASTDQNFTGLISLLMSNGRISALPHVAIIFSKLVDEAKKLLALEVTSAFPLQDAERAEISARVQKDYGSLATISWKVDRALIGGLTVKSGDKLLDGSVRGSLEHARTVLDS